MSNEDRSLMAERDPSLPYCKAEVNAELGQVIREMLSPVMESMAKFMQNNTEALERLAAAQKMQSDRMEALEKQIRLNTLVTPTQVRYLNDAIRKHARELLAKKELDDDVKAIKTLGNAIRKSIISRYGTASLREVPKHEYSVAMQQIDTWNDMLLLRDVMKEARNRHESALPDAEPAAGVDGA